MFSSNTTNVNEQPDPQFNYVTMLLHGDGTNGGQNNTFVDSSTNNFSITRNGNATQGSFSPYGTLWSNYVDGSTDFIYCSPSNLTGQYTIEGWFCADDYDPAINRVFFGNWTTGFLVRYNSGSLEFYSKPGGSTVSGSASVTLKAGQWYHIQVTRDGSNVQRVFVDGVLTITTSAGSGTITMTNFCIGAEKTSVAGTADQFKGYISNFRILNGTCLNTSNFTPPTQPLTAITNTSLLTCQSNRFVDNSASPLTLTLSGTPSVQRFSPFAPSAEYGTTTIGGSGYFDGTDDYLRITNSSATGLGSGNFTVESWIYLSAIPSATPFAIVANGERYYRLYVNSGSLQFWWRISATDYSLTSSAITWVTNTWYHVAAVRNGTSITLYLNGTSVGTTTTGTSGTIENIGDIGVGGLARPSSVLSWPFNGYLSDTRLVVGTAVYTSAFTPPTAPLTAITNTSLLTNFTNGAIFDNAMMNDLETVGNAQISTSVKKYGTGSLAFDGTGDYLAGPYSPNLDFGTGDFTVELWFYFNGSVTGAGFIGSKNIGGMDFAFTSSSLRIGRINTAWDSTFSWSPSANTWYHIAFTRSNGTARAFVNGTQVGSDSSNTNNYYPNGGIYVGVSAPPDRYVNGYIDDLRITKGVARYTANFTPPTAPFPNN